MWWKEVDDTVDRFRCRRRVQGGENEVPSLGRRQCCEHRLGVPHLTHQDDVRVLAEHDSHGTAERISVEADLALVDSSRPVTVKTLDGVFHGDDVAGAGLVDVVDHGGQGRRLP